MTTPARHRGHGSPAAIRGVSPHTDWDFLNTPRLTPCCHPALSTGTLALCSNLIHGGYINRSHFGGSVNNPSGRRWSGTANMPCEPGLSGAIPLLRPQWTGHWFTGSLDVQFWTDIFSMEITSNECLTKVRSLLNCPSKIAIARSFRRNEAQTFIDFLDRVSKWRAPCLDSS